MKVVKDGMVSKLLKDTRIPKMFHARQTFPGDKISPEEIPGVVARELVLPSRQEAAGSAM